MTFISCNLEVMSHKDGFYKRNVSGLLNLMLTDTHLFEGFSAYQN